MSRVSRKVWKLLHKVDRMPRGPAARAVLDEALTLADDASDDDLRYAARVRLLSMTPELGDGEAMLTTFAWCTAKNETDPARFPAAGPGFDLLWSHKWIAGQLSANPIFPREDIDAALEQLTVAYQRAGVGEAGVVQTKFLEALDNGRLDEAGHWYERVLSTPDDAYSDCAACVASAKVRYLVAAGRPADGIAVAERALEDRLACAEEPEGLMAQTLLPLLRAGRVEQARTWHGSSYRQCRTEPQKIAIVANHLTFCAVSGDLGRGLELLERHLGWLGHNDLDVAGRLRLLLAAGTLLDALIAAGAGDQPAPRATDRRVVAAVGAATPPTIAAFAPLVWQASATLAAAFDERNGNTAWARRLEEARALAAEVRPVDVGGQVQRPRVSTTPSADAADWDERAVTFATFGHEAEAAHAAQRGLAEEPTIDVRVRLLGVLASVSPPDQVDAAIAARVAALRESGDVGLADLEEDLGRLRWVDEAEPADVDVVRARLARTTDPWVRTEAAWILARLLPEGDPAQDEVAAVIETAAREAGNPLRLADLATVQAHRSDMAGDAERALELLDAATGLRDEAERLAATGERVGCHAPLPVDGGRRLFHHLVRGQALAALGREADAVGELDAAADAAAAFPLRSVAAEASALAATALTDAGMLGEAVLRWRSAVEQARLGELPEIARLQLELGRALVMADRPDEAVDELARALDSAARAGDEHLRIEALTWIGHGHVALDEADLALEAWRTAVDLGSQTHDHAAVAYTGALLARLLAEFGEESALDVADQAVRAARRVAEPPLLLHTLRTTGMARAPFDPRAGLAELEQAGRVATEIGDELALADLLDSRARVHADQGHLDDAVRLALQAADRFTALGLSVPAAGSTGLAGQILLGADRPQEAVGLLQAAVDGSADDPGMHAHACLLAGDCYEALGRHVEAQAVRARVSG